jgi:DNA-binding transcriptional regulator YbjK
MALGQLIGQAFTNVQPQISQALNNLAALSSVNPEQMAQAVTEQMSISQLAKKLETSQLAKSWKLSHKTEIHTT